MKFATSSVVTRLLLGSARVLVCETDGFSLRGAVLGRDGSELAVLHSAQSKLPVMEEAVADLAAQLQASGWRGGRAVLLTPGVVPALLELPVDPKQPRPVEQMEDLVRWEMEPMLMQHTTLWSVGRILVGLGYLTEEQARAVLDAQQGRGKPDGELEVYSFKRFGDLAIELGYITRLQLDECLVRQEWLKTESDEIACGWSAQAAQADEADEADEAGGSHHRWLACSVNRSLMQRWVAVFARHGVKLQQLYPLTGCAAALLTEGDAERLVIETHAGVAAATQIVAGAVQGLQVRHAPLWLLLEAHAGLVTATNMQAGDIHGFHMHQAALSGPLEACLEAYHALTPPEPDVLWLAAMPDETGDLPKQLEQMLGRKVGLLAGKVPEHAAERVTPGMLGAARHVLGLAEANRCSGVLTNGPKKPLAQRLEFRAAAAGMLLVLGIGAAETVLQVRTELAEAKKARVEQEAAKMDGAINAVQKEIGRVKAQQEKLKAKRSELAQAEARVRFFGEELPERAAFAQALLGSLEQSVTDEVVIDRIEEIPVNQAAKPLQTALAAASGVPPPVGGFRLSAWALSDSAAQQLVQAMKNAMQPWGMAVQDVVVVARSGRLGLNGHAVEMRIVTPPEIKPATAESAGGKA